MALKYIFGINNFLFDALAIKFKLPSAYFNLKLFKLELQFAKSTMVSKYFRKVVISLDMTGFPTELISIVAGSCI